MILNVTFSWRFFLLLLCMAVVIAPAVQAQREMDNWQFSVNANLNFSTGNPVNTANTPMNAAEGSASISDASGNLLFYSDGQTVWNSTHTPMANGTGLLGHFSSSQAALIMPMPGSTTQYYLFTNGHHNDNNGLRYSIVDMSQNGGLGAVTATKNVVIIPGPNTEQLMAVKHCNDTDFWLITRGWNNTQFLAYLVTSAGINMTPVVSNSSFNLTTLSSNPSIGNVARIGYMKASPTGTRVAAFHAWSNVIELAEFNPWNGQFSNILILDAVPASFPMPPIPTCYLMPYTGEFSPNGRYFYTLVNYFNANLGMGNNPSSLLYQFDISVMNAGAIEASRFLIDSVRSLEIRYNGAGAIQIANNGRLYVGYAWNPQLSVINTPNNAGAGCGYVYNAFTLGAGANFRAAFPNFPPFYLADFTQPDFSFAGNCDSTNVAFHFNDPQSVDSVIWSFGDPASGASNTSKLDSPIHRYTTPGSHTVRLIVHKSSATICLDPIDTITKEVFIPYLNIGNDTSLCADSLRLPLYPIMYPGGKYLWNTGDTLASISAKTSGKYWLEQTQKGCAIADTIEIDLNGDPVINLGSDTNICHTDLPFVLRSPQPPGTHYTWSTGLTDSQISVVQSGTYWLEVTRNACLGSDTIKIKVIQVPEISAGEDTIICEAWPIRLGTVIADATYEWNTGDTNPYIQVGKTGSYVLSVNIEGCVVKDTVEVTAMPSPPLDLGPDGDICPEQIIALNATAPNSTIYKWNTGDITPVYNATQPGTYAVTVISEYGCISSDTITLSYYAIPTVILGNDTVVCPETPLMLTALYAINEDSLLWSNGSSAREQIITQGGSYIVRAINKCGFDADTINIQEVSCDIWLPNAFTPNSDGKNDVYKILGNTRRMQDVNFSIYNRWGEQLFNTRDKSQGWDGTYKGEDAPVETYMYLLQYSFEGKPFVQKDNFHLLR